MLHLFQEMSIFNEIHGKKKKSVFFFLISIVKCLKISSNINNKWKSLQSRFLIEYKAISLNEQFFTCDNHDNGKTNMTEVLSKLSQLSRKCRYSLRISNHLLRFVFCCNFIKGHFFLTFIRSRFLWNLNFKKKLLFVMTRVLSIINDLH